MKNPLYIEAEKLEEMIRELVEKQITFAENRDTLSVAKCEFAVHIIANLKSQMKPVEPLVEDVFEHVDQVIATCDDDIGKDYPHQYVREAIAESKQQFFENLNEKT